MGSRHPSSGVNIGSCYQDETTPLQAAQRGTQLTPDEYEQLVASILRQEGWAATVTSSGGDRGLDVIAEKSGIRLGMQVKMYDGAGPIHAATIMLTHGAAAFADCTRCMIATNGRVLADAAAVAAKLNVEIRFVLAVCSCGHVSGRTPSRWLNPASQDRSPVDRVK